MSIEDEMMLEEKIKKFQSKAALGDVEYRTDATYADYLISRINLGELLANGLNVSDDILKMEAMLERKFGADSLIVD